MTKRSPTLRDITASPAAPETDIAGLTADSRQVQPGFLFAALAGTAANGADYIDDAIRRGAVAILSAPGVALTQPGITHLTDDNPRRAFAEMAARFTPAQPETIAAVTGTNGKTSVVHFAAQIWTDLGLSAASLGTLGVRGPVSADPLELTTPEPVALHRALADLAGQGVACLALEASSHGLDQHRLDGVHVRAAAFTNLSHDHLDYHASRSDYLAAKMRLFTEIMEPGGAAVLNAAAGEYAELRAACEARGHRIIAYGPDGADLSWSAFEAGEHGISAKLKFGGKTTPVALPLFGDFQLANAVCALGLVLATGGEAAPAIDALNRLEAAPGRLDLVAAHPAGARVFVDYAHTPDALCHALAALRRHAPGRLVVVFGCGGDRDRVKRPEMGRIAARLADHVIVTDDNPRSEDAAAIRQEILAGCPDASQMGDRSEAIVRAIEDLDAGDALLIAGKGHETTQTTGDKIRAFDDSAVARDAVANLAVVWT
jgi:UDP-N-acetylmuramoyl-L-alanyl-D-glutamate--2,6-diaminopimelate ligase